MPSFQDSAVIFFIALILFGPKKLPELARQLGKLMGEFRRASNEFRVQMEDELRTSEQAERQKQIAAMEAAAPVAPAIQEGEGNTIAPHMEVLPSQVGSQAIADTIEDPLDSHPHMPPPDRHTAFEPTPASLEQAAPLPIASSGDLHLMPPATGLPVSRSGSTSLESSVLSPIFDSLPQKPAHDPLPASEHIPRAPALSDEAVTHG
ncbi:MAG: hypothetical protein NVSMB3_05640 [Acidobacteriaceae bacterium]